MTTVIQDVFFKTFLQGHFPTISTEKKNLVQTLMVVFVIHDLLDLTHIFDYCHVLDADHLQKLIHLAKKMLPTTQTEALGEVKVTFVFLLKKYFV